MVLYIRSGICYTKKEMNQAISEGKGNKEDFFSSAYIRGC
jgi:hypothetical protein